MRLIAVCLFWIASVMPLAAQDQAVADRMVDAFERWMKANDVRQGAISIWYRGKPVVADGVGQEFGQGVSMPGDAPMEMASLGKAVTGVCIAALVREGRLAYADQFADVFGRGPLVSVAQLLSHSSGLKFDSTQRSMAAWLDRGDDHAHDVLDAVIARGGPAKRPNKFRYNNENYALLGLLIEKVSGEPYEAACRKRVFDPAGVVATRSPRVGGFLPWGGWRMSVEDYARFLNHWFGAKTALGEDPFGQPHFEVEGGAFYGNGMFFRAFRGSYNFWHHGALCFPGRLNGGSFAVMWMGEWSAVAAYDVCPSWEAAGNIDAALSGAVFQ